MPDPARQADARSIGKLARLCEELLDGILRNAPGVGEAKRPGLVVPAEITPALPAFGLADRADGGLHCRGHAVGIGERPADRVLQGLQLLGALALGDGLADAAIALEGAGCVEYRLAAHADPDLPPGLVQPAQLQIAEGLARIEQRDVRGPVLLAHVVVLDIPASLSDRF